MFDGNINDEDNVDEIVTKFVKLNMNVMNGQCLAVCLNEHWNEWLEGAELSFQCKCLVGAMAMENGY